MIAEYCTRYTIQYQILAVVIPKGSGTLIVDTRPRHRSALHVPLTVDFHRQLIPVSNGKRTFHRNIMA